MRTAAVGVVLAMLATVHLAPPVAARQDAPADGDDTWREILEQAVVANREVAFDGRLVIVAFDGRGPSIAEVEVSQDPSGDLRVSGGETWMIAREDTEGFLLRAGALLRLGPTEDDLLDLDRLAGKYTASMSAQRDLDTGPALTLELREHGVDTVRERLFIDVAMGVVVRRETFAADGAPERLVAFTALTARTTALAAMPVDEGPPRGEPREISDDGVEMLVAMGWRVPETLPGGYDLLTTYALPEDEGSSVHLVYGDGLYTLSIYQQLGTLDAAALSGAVAGDERGMHAYRWPGAEPARMVWTAEALTFTAVTDAPADHLMSAVSALPHEPAPSTASRMLRGLGRVADVLWPFN